MQCLWMRPQVIWCSSSSFWRCVLDHCHVEKQMMFPQITNQSGWHVTAECCGSHAGSVCHYFWIDNQQFHQQNPPQHLTSFSMLHSGTTYPWCMIPSLYLLCVYKDMAVETKNLKFGLIRPKYRFSLVKCPFIVFLGQSSSFFARFDHESQIHTVFLKQYVNVTTDWNTHERFTDQVADTS